MIKEKTKNDRFLKYIVELPLILVEDILSGKIGSGEEAADKVLKIYWRNDAKKLRNTNTRSNSNPNFVKNMLIGLEYKIFGDSGLENKGKDLEPIPEESEEQTISEEEKIYTATGEEDIGDPPPLETEEEAEKRQGKTTGKGLKILTPQQMITRLPILLAQLKAGNNSQKFKNEIRQLSKLFIWYKGK